MAKRLSSDAREGAVDDGPAPARPRLAGAPREVRVVEAVALLCAEGACAEVVEVVSAVAEQEKQRSSVWNPGHAAHGSFLDWGKYIVGFLDEVSVARLRATSRTLREMCDAVAPPRAPWFAFHVAADADNDVRCTVMLRGIDVASWQHGVHFAMLMNALVHGKAETFKALVARRPPASPREIYQVSCTQKDVVCDFLHEESGIVKDALHGDAGHGVRSELWNAFPRFAPTTETIELAARYGFFLGVSAYDFGLRSTPEQLAVYLKVKMWEKGTYPFESLERFIEDKKEQHALEMLPYLDIRSHRWRHTLPFVALVRDLDDLAVALSARFPWTTGDAMAMLNHSVCVGKIAVFARMYQGGIPVVPREIIKALLWQQRPSIDFAGEKALLREVFGLPRAARRHLTVLTDIADALFLYSVRDDFPSLACYARMHAMVRDQRACPILAGIADKPDSTVVRTAARDFRSQDVVPFRMAPYTVKKPLVPCQDKSGWLCSHVEAVVPVVRVLWALRKTPIARCAEYTTAVDKAMRAASIALFAEAVVREDATHEKTIRHAFRLFDEFGVDADALFWLVMMILVPGLVQWPAFTLRVAPRFFRRYLTETDALFFLMRMKYATRSRGSDDGSAWASPRWMPHVFRFAARACPPQHVFARWVLVIRRLPHDIFRGIATYAPYFLRGDLDGACEQAPPTTAAEFAVASIDEFLQRVDHGAYGPFDPDAVHGAAFARALPRCWSATTFGEIPTPINALVYPDIAVAPWSIFDGAAPRMNLWGRRHNPT